MFVLRYEKEPIRPNHIGCGKEPIKPDYMD